MPNKQTYSVQGVEIFSVGIWNGDEYTMDDLTSMVDAFEQTKEGIPPFLKLGHDDNQKILQEDGYPAAGWISRLYIQGQKLVADFEKIPKKIFELITTNAYRKVSSEIYWNIKIGDKVYTRLLGAVALLGSDMPAVSNLKDILSIYKVLGENQARVYTDNVIELNLKKYSINLNTKENKMPGTKTELEIKLELEAKQNKEALEKAQEEAKQYKLNLEKAEQEKEELKKFKTESEAKEAVLLKEKMQAEKESFFTTLVSEKLATPSMKSYVLELLGEEKKEYSVKIQDKETKLNKENLLKETLKLFKLATAVNFDESSASGDKNAFSKDYKEINEKITKYAAENKVSYGQAAKIVLKENK